MSPVYSPNGPFRLALAAEHLALEHDLAHRRRLDAVREALDQRERLAAQRAGDGELVQPVGHARDRHQPDRRIGAEDDRAGSRSNAA